jgi:peptide/nickel transport system substrate-binding protein
MENLNMLSRTVAIRLLTLSLIALTIPTVLTRAIADDTLRITYSTPVVSLDPHWPGAGAQTWVSQHIFEALVLRDAQSRLTPGLADRWTRLDNTTWDFHLRVGARFSDSAPLVAADVIASFTRARNVKGVPSTLAQFLTSVDAIDVIDDLTVRIHTAGPAPLLPSDLAFVRIVPHSALTATTADFNGPSRPVGTGPYSVADFVPGERIVLARNELYWAGRPRWDRVVIKTSASPPARVAALLANDTMLIDAVPASDVAQLKGDPNIRVTAGLGSRVHFITMDQARDVSPFITDKAGRALPSNPLKDVRVRRALSLAIDRVALVERLAAGQGKPAGQMMPELISGSVPDQSALPTDPAAARKLLAEAGWADGFAITMHTTADDRSAIAQAVAQMLARIGVITRVEVLPQQIMSTRAFRGELSMGLETFSLSTAEVWTMMRGYMTTNDVVRAVGQSNSGRYKRQHHATTMFVRFRETGRGLQMSLVETRRIGGRGRHSNVVAVGSRTVAGMCEVLGATAEGAFREARRLQVPDKPVRRDPCHCLARMINALSALVPEREGQGLGDFDRAGRDGITWQLPATRWPNWRIHRAERRSRQQALVLLAQA